MNELLDEEQQRQLLRKLIDAVQSARSEVWNIASHMRRPSVLYKPTLERVQGQWVAIYGELEVIGDTPGDAMRRFDAAWGA